MENVKAYMIGLHVLGSLKTEMQQTSTSMVSINEFLKSCIE